MRRRIALGAIRALTRHRCTGTVAAHRERLFMSIRKLVLLALLSSVASPHAHAQTTSAYPMKPVRIIVPFTPGGPADAIARPIAQGLSERLGQQFIVDFRPGAGGNIGAEI